MRLVYKVTPDETCLILTAYSAAVHKLLLKYAIRCKIADYHDLAPTVIKDRSDADAISVHVPGSKRFERNVHLVEIYKKENIRVALLYFSGRQKNRRGDRD